MKSNLFSSGVAPQSSGTGAFKLLAAVVSASFCLQASAATFTVTNIDDTGAGSLRDAIAQANALPGTDTIDFDTASVFATPQTITLTSGEILITESVSINGTGADQLAVDGNNNDRVFHITAGIVTISGLTITNGNSINGGGAIENTGATLTLSGCAVSGNVASGYSFGGGIENGGGSTLTIINSTLSNNSATLLGGGIENNGGSTLTIINSTLSGNSAAQGGAIDNSSSTTTITNSTLSGNSAATGGGIYNLNTATLEIGSTLLKTGNLGPNIANSGSSATVISDGYNLSSDAAGGDTGTGPGGLLNGTGDRRNTDPRLESLADNGGPTQTIALQPNSPAIDQGKDLSSSGADERGSLRPVDNPFIADTAGGDGSDIGAFEAQGPFPTPTPVPTTLGNISTRLLVGTGDNASIGGFIITGTQPKKVMVRAIGPSLPLAGVLADPTLELHDGAGAMVASNDNWMDAPNQQEIIDTTIPPADNLESAILMSLDPGPYTAIVGGANNATGIGLVEAYDLDLTADSALANISTRGQVQAGDNAMIGGIIVLGSAPKTVLLRAIGPSLPLAGVLADPILELHDKDGATIATNDNWRSDQEAEIMATTIPPADDAESAILAVLTPDAYTAIVRGKNDTTGIALVEAYQLNN